MLLIQPSSAAAGRVFSVVLKLIVLLTAKRDLLSENNCVATSVRLNPEDSGWVHGWGKGVVHGTVECEHVHRW